MNDWHNEIEIDDTDELDAAREERAEEIAEALENCDHIARVWTGGRNIHVYVSRTLSRGHRQDMGYIEVEYDGCAVPCLTRAKAGTCDMIGLCR